MKVVNKADSFDKNPELVSNFEKTQAPAINISVQGFDQQLARDNVHITHSHLSEVNT